MGEFVFFIILVIVIIFSIIVTLIITKGNYRASYEPIEYSGGVETEEQKRANYETCIYETNPFSHGLDGVNYITDLIEKFSNKKGKIFKKF